MALKKNISTAVSIAAALLLEACSETGSAPEPEANTRAPLLIGTWQTDCIRTSSGTTTFTGSSGGTTITSGGDAYRANASFTKEGRFELKTEEFSSVDCNPTTSFGIKNYQAVYYVGDASFANDGSNVINVDYRDSNTSSYSIFQTNNGFFLRLGDSNTSSEDLDGSDQNSRHDGLGVEFTKR